MNKLVVCLTDDQALWFDRLAEKGWKKADVVRLLIRECMVGQRTRDNPIEVMKLDDGKELGAELPNVMPKAKEQLDAITRAEARVRAKAAAVEEEARIAESERAYFEAQEKQIGFEAAYVAWCLDHDFAPLPEWLIEKKTQYHIEQWQKTHPDGY